MESSFYFMILSKIVNVLYIVLSILGNSSIVTRSRCGDGVSVVMTVPHRVELI